MTFFIPVLLFFTVITCTNGDMGKKGSANGKKADKDCTDEFKVLSGDCPITINQPGRYVLELDLSCGPDSNGIEITADDVLLDCQDNQIIGSGGTTNGDGIVVTGSEHVTITNCHVTQFLAGLFADDADWTDLVIENSSFNRNTDDGMNIQGDFSNPGGSTVTVVNSEFNNNGDDGVRADFVAGTFISSQMNDNVENGFDDDDSMNSLKLIDVTTNNNGEEGIESQSSIEVIKSTACYNGAINPEVDVDFNGVDVVSQGNTCGTSEPPTVNGRSVCECSCPDRTSSVSSVNSVMDTPTINHTTKDDDEDEVRPPNPPAMGRSKEKVSAVGGGR